MPHREAWKAKNGKPMSRRHVSVRLEPDRLARVDALIPSLSTKYTAVTRSDVLRALIEVALPRFEAEAAQVLAKLLLKPEATPMLMLVPPGPEAKVPARPSGAAPLDPEPPRHDDDNNEPADPSMDLDDDEPASGPSGGL